MSDIHQLQAWLAMQQANAVNVKAGAEQAAAQARVARRRAPAGAPRRPVQADMLAAGRAGALAAFDRGAG